MTEGATIIEFEVFDEPDYTVVVKKSLESIKFAVEQLIRDFDISEMMKSLINCRNPNILNNELRDIVKNISRDIPYIEQLLEMTKKNYFKSKEDLVSILIPKRE